MPHIEGYHHLSLSVTDLAASTAWYGATLGLDHLYIKDESLNPTNSFKARGQAAAITRAKYLGARTIALPTAGNLKGAVDGYAKTFA